MIVIKVFYRGSFPHPNSIWVALATSINGLIVSLILVRWIEAIDSTRIKARHYILQRVEEVRALILLLEQDRSMKRNLDTGVEVYDNKMKKNQRHTTNEKTNMHIDIIN